MGKKKTYKLSEHQQQHNRVDYFRSIQIPKSALAQDDKQSPEFSYNVNNQYTNPSFITSNDDLKFPNRTSRMQSPHNGHIWSTASYLPSEQTFKPNLKPNNKSKDQRSAKLKYSNSNAHSTKFKLICVLSSLFILLVLAAIGFALAYFYYWKPLQESKQLYLKACNEECVGNRYCVCLFIYFLVNFFQV
jgi:hypothetical protein